MIKNGMIHWQTEVHNFISCATDIAVFICLMDFTVLIDMKSQKFKISSIAKNTHPCKAFYFLYSSKSKMYHLKCFISSDFNTFTKTRDSIKTSN